MDPAKYAKTFYLEDQHVGVGYFEDEELPSKPGQYRYMPFRRVEHYNFLRAIGSGKPGRCHFLVGEAKCYFLVLRLLEYGVLEIGELDASGQHQT
jgi:hypothetical protein